MTLIEQYLKDNPVFIPAVVGFLINQDKVLLGLRKKVSNNLGLNLISGIGGKVGDSAEIANESTEEALAREFQEETGIKIVSPQNTGRVRFIWTHKPKWNQDVTIFIIKEWKDNPIETEAIKSEWYPINNLPKQQMWEDNLYWVPKILNGESIDAVFLYGEDEKVIDHKFF
jgi:8-oxo-dGTP diphosphatase